MGLTLTEKILKAHIVDGELIKGTEIGLRIDQTLTQDATGTMAYLEYEAMGVPRVKTELSVAYIDHNTLQNGFENADDHRFIGSVTKKHGIRFSRPGNGICHQVHLERFGIPGKTLIGSDSHTPTGGGIGMLAMGAGGLDVAVAMGGGAYYITCPKVVRVNLTGKLSPWVAAKDVILEVLRRMSVKGGVGKVIEYCGEGVKTLSVPERATITNMGAELGATTSIFPSDEVTREFLTAQGRGEVWTPLAADPDAAKIGFLYDKSQDSSTSAIQAAKDYCDEHGISYVEKTGTTTGEIQAAADSLVAEKVDAIFTPQDNTVMTAELAIFEKFADAGIPHYTSADSFALNGAFLGYGVNYETLGTKTADMVADILANGADPATTPVETLDSGIVTVNTEIAEKVGIDYSIFKDMCSELIETVTAEEFN